MAFSENLADRLRLALASQEDLEEKKMMGGLTFMVNSKMCVGIIKDDLMVRVNPDIHAELIEQNGCREMDFTGKPMKGYVLVSPETIETEKELHYGSIGVWHTTTLRKHQRKKVKNEFLKHKGNKVLSSCEGLILCSLCVSKSHFIQ